MTTALLAHALPALIIFFASFMQSVTGFGVVIIAAPLLMFFYDPKLTVLIMFVTAFFTNITQTVFIYKDGKYKTVLDILIGYIIAQPLGLYIYNSFSSSQLRLLVGIAILASLLLMGFTHVHFRQIRRNNLVVGFLAGVLAVTTGMAGPPLILYFAYTDMTPKELRGTTVLFFLTSGVFSMAYFFMNGIDLWPATVESLYLIPGLVLGILVGQRVLPYVSVRVFRRCIFAMLYFVCFYTFYSVLCA